VASVCSCEGDGEGACEGDREGNGNGVAVDEVVGAAASYSTTKA
jgi:hypothetical protein